MFPELLWIFFIAKLSLPDADSLAACCWSISTCVMFPGIATMLTVVIATAEACNDFSNKNQG